MELAEFPELVEGLEAELGAGEGHGGERGPVVFTEGSWDGFFRDEGELR